MVALREVSYISDLKSDNSIFFNLIFSQVYPNPEDLPEKWGGFKKGAKTTIFNDPTVERIRR